MTGFIEMARPVGFAALTVCGLTLAALVTPAEGDGPDSQDAKVSRLVRVETAVLEVTPVLEAIAQGLASGRPTGGKHDPVLVVSPPVQAIGSRDWSPSPGPPGLRHETFEFRLGDREASVEGHALPVWPALRELVARWEGSHFGVLSARFSGDDGLGGDLLVDAKFDAAATGRDNSRLGVRARQEVRFARDGERWVVREWRQTALSVERVTSPLFEDVLDAALPDSWARERARRSLHEEMTAAALSSATLRVPKAEFADVPDMESAYQFPSVSVVDYDGDGWDDLFLTARWDSPQLLRNRGDGTFEDVTARAGFAGIERMVNCALFADFDNDGDPDAVLGRSLEPSLYLLNDAGRFRDVTGELSDLGDQFLVSSAAAADVNRDGLLDVYLSTYSPGTDVLPVWKERYLKPDEAARLDALSAGSHPYFDDRGAPNVLLVNRGGGRLERAGGEAVKLWRKSYQPAWADLDGDGDDDLYVCNDFAPDSLLRNDTPPGAADPVLTEAFGEFFPERKLAFGMGASFGDYDNDGDLDLFVSNMYSKAGNRIIAHVGEVDPRVALAAQGNFLYRNDGGRFLLATSKDDPAVKVGWAFGGQFGDFDNDGRLDLYVPSGYYTAPAEVATGLDL
jgi:hypothetical protein